MKVAKAIFKHIELGLRIVAKLLLLLPLLMGMVWFNFRVDRAGLFQEDAYVQTLASALLAGENLYGYGTWDERSTLADYVAELPDALDTIVVGSSRVLQIGSEMAGTDSFYNCGMSGADFRDILNTYYLFEKADKLPANMIIGLDAWLFNPATDSYSEYSDITLYEEFLQVALGVDTGYVEPHPEEEPEKSLFEETHLNALLDVAYFQASLDYYFSDEYHSPAQKEDNEGFEAPVVDGDLYNQPTDVKMADGSVLYNVAYRTADLEEVNERARVHAGTFVRVDDYQTLDAELMNIFMRFIQHVQGQGVNVVFLLVPYHPSVYNYATENAEEWPAFFEAEQWFAGYAVERNIPLYGSYNPFVMDCENGDFYDGLHITADALSRVLPQVGAILTEQKSARAGSPWIYGETRVSEDVTQRIVAERYEIEFPEVLVRTEDRTLYENECYVFERFATEEDTLVLAQYAVSKAEGVIYRLNTNIDAWVVDERFLD